MTVALFAGIRVRDLTAARAWYERLLGEPSFFPNASEVVWTVADERSLYIQEDPRRAGSALITVFVDDLDPAHRRDQLTGTGAGRARDVLQRRPQGDVPR
jgi:hypothetical protein